MKNSKIHAADSCSVSVRTLSAQTLRSDVQDTIDKPSHGSFVSRLSYLCKVNQQTNAGKRIQMVKMLILTIIPTVALIVLCVIDVTNNAEKSKAAYEVRDMVTLSTEIGQFVHYLQRERGYSSLYTSADGQAQYFTRELMLKSYKDTINVLEKLSRWPGETNTKFEQFPTRQLFINHLENHRDSVLSGNIETGMRRELKFYNNLVLQFINWMYEAIQFSKTGDDWRQLVAYQLLLISKNSMGIERTLGSIFYVFGNFDDVNDYKWYLEQKGMGEANFNASALFSPVVKDLFKSGISKDDKNVTFHIAAMRDEISRNNKQNTSGSYDMSLRWFGNMSIYLDIMFDVQLGLADIILNAISEDLSDNTRGIVVSVAILCVVLIICPIIIITVKRLVGDIQKFALNLADQTKQLHKERQRTESLLYQMLPRPVADQLKSNRTVDAETFEEVTIFFSDIVGFTSISAACNPMEVVGLLNTLYLCFDTRLELYDVYKVETIGDAYMVASGVPNRNGRRHVPEVATMALDLAHHVTHLEIPHLPNTLLRLRAGIHTGPVVAGVVGSKMPRYCLFGDSVNTASRMESTGQADRIQMSWISHAIIQQQGGFKTVKRGLVEVKGKGNMETYWLLNKDGFEDSLACMPNCHKFSDAEYRRASQIVQ